jgi:hypothetical protein
MKIVMTFVAEIELAEEDLESYDATTIQEAAENQAAWLAEGSMTIEDFVPDMKLVSSEGVE